MSACKQGVYLITLVPAPYLVGMFTKVVRLDVRPTHSVMTPDSVISSSRSPSQYVRKFTDGRLVEMDSPAALYTSLLAVLQYSCPREAASMSAHNPRPTSVPVNTPASTSPVKASCISTPYFADTSSCTIITSNPGRSGTKSPTCMASPCPKPVR